MSPATTTKDADVVLGRIARIGVLPVLVIDDPADARRLADALMAGGLDAVEVTFRTPAAEDAIQAMAGIAGLLVGAGTVIDPTQVDRAVDAGAQFVVSPGWSDAVVRRCAEREIPIVPGVATASDVQRAVEHGIEVVKLFPAEAAGGVATVKALSAPFAQMRFIPTGGVSEQNLASYLAISSVLAVGGSWMVSPALVRAGNWAEITRLAAAAVDTVDTVRADT